MTLKFSSLALGAAVAALAGCSHPQKYTSNMGADTPVTTGGQKVASENPGREGPVADQSRLAINHRDVAERQKLERQKLAQDKERRRRTQVTDTTYTRSSAPVAAVKQSSEGATKAKKKKVAAKVPAPAAVRAMNRAVALNALHHVNEKEIAMAKLAADRAGRDEVKQTAAKLQRDHEQLEARVAEVAKKHDVNLAGFTPATFEGVETVRLEELKGPDFDYAYTQTMEDGHRVTVAQLRTLRARASDADVIALIDETLPKVQNHRQHSENVLGSIQTDDRNSASR